MREAAGGLLYSATDLVNFLGCSHNTALDLRQLTNPVELPGEDEYLELLREKGIAHERAYRDRLRADGRSIVEVDSSGPLEQRVTLTREAMADGAEVIYQGALFAPPWHGYSDFLLRVDHLESRLGPYGYEVIDTKLARSAKPTHVIQLSVYSQLVTLEQGVSPRDMHIVLGDGSTVPLRVSDFVHYCEIAGRRFAAFAAPPPKATSAEPCAHCGFCHWRDRCEAEWDRIDHLSLVANISRTQIGKLRADGVTTIRALAALPDGSRIPNIQSETLHRLSSQARLQVGKRDGGPNAVEVLPLMPQRGFARLPQPDEGDLFFDMEGDPLYEGGLEYLFGFDYADGGTTRFLPLWAHDRDSEKKAFQDAVAFIMARLSAFPAAHVYHYASYEESALKRLAMLHGTCEAEIDDLLRGRKLVDLYKVVREGIRVSEPAYSIKNLEAFYAGERAGEVATAGESIVVYERWRRIGAARLLNEIADYNEADCKSTHRCRDWLLGLRPSSLEWFTARANAEPSAAKDQENRREVEARTAGLQAALVVGVAPEERPWRELLGHLLEFHRREAKPQWWEMFNRQTMSVEELIDDAECIGGLTRDPKCPPYSVKKSIVHTFCFEPQDFKMRTGESPLRAGTLEPAGEIIGLDDEGRRVSLKVGPSRSAFVEPLSLIPGGPPDAKVLRDAIYSYAQAVLAGQQDKYAAVTAVLRKDAPRVANLAPGAAIIPREADQLAGAIEAIGRLDNSYVLVQGPPGAGKTFTSSHAIVELLSRGKRVGVSSLTHKAINNLLKAVEQLAVERGVAFRGVKKANSPDQLLNGGGLIEDTMDNAVAARGGHQLVAGTAWLFARPDLDQALDYLFIDEAGQVSLAQVVAMGLSARNLVLIGDQMQLSQPVQGVHPLDSGSSALEYLLGDLATVPADRGIFLAITHRLNPDICQFISDAFYDGRLRPADGNDRQQLVLASSVDPEALAPSGLRFVPVEHDGCTQESEEEAARIRQTYEALLAQRWIDRDGRGRPISLDDILVVSPYNIQVDLLRTALPPGARVGTVDRFQGQEAPVVLISMTTSSGEDIPRNIEFLFSRNRLNVAISRARCLAVVFASPRLLEITCKTIDQMRLVNTLCWVRTYAESQQQGLPTHPQPRYG